MDFSGKNILVTGGGGVGVGAGVCKILSRYGARIIVNELHCNDVEKAAEKYANAIPIAADIRKENEVDDMFANLRDKLGVIHGLVNNAGVGLSKLAHQVSAEEFDNIFDTDIKGLWHVSKAFVNQLLDAGQSGNIVNITSVHAHSTISRYAIYASCKSAVEGLTRGMAVELGRHNIRVNAIGPGYVKAEQNINLISTWSNDPQQWIEDLKDDHQVLNFEIEPEDCGNVVAFLLSELSRGVTGQTIYVDNGSISLLYNRSFTECR